MGVYGCFWQMYQCLLQILDGLWQIYFALRCYDGWMFMDV